MAYILKFIIHAAMKTKFNYFLSLILLISCASSAYNLKQDENQSQGPISFYDYRLVDIFGEAYDMDQLRGKKVLVVNTASSCGLTPQYAELQELYNKYGETGLVILGFPSNSFKNQEPRNNKEIQAFCEKNFGVTFPMMQKTEIIGENQHPLFRWLTNKELNSKMDVHIDNAFYKFMINEDGSLEGFVNPEVKPTDSRIIDWLKE